MVMDLNSMRRYQGRKLSHVDNGRTYEGYGAAERIWGGRQVVRIDLIEPLEGIEQIYAPSDEVRII